MQKSFAVWVPGRDQWSPRLASTSTSVTQSRASANKDAPTFGGHIVSTADQVPGTKSFTNFTVE